MTICPICNGKLTDMLFNKRKVDWWCPNCRRIFYKKELTTIKTPLKSKKVSIEKVTNEIMKVLYNHDKSLTYNEERDLIREILIKNGVNHG